MFLSAVCINCVVLHHCTVQFIWVLCICIFYANATLELPLGKNKVILISSNNEKCFFGFSPWRSRVPVEWAGCLTAVCSCCKVHTEQSSLSKGGDQNDVNVRLWGDASNCVTMASQSWQFARQMSMGLIRLRTTVHTVWHTYSKAECRPDGLSTTSWLLIYDRDGKFKRRVLTGLFVPASTLNCLNEVIIWTCGQLTLCVQC